MNIEFFPCSGGMAEGARRAGIVFDMAFDKDPHACDSYEANHGHRPVQMDVHDLLRMARGGGWRPKDEVDLLVADPPCTPWSRAGKREGLADPRDCLKATAELIALLRPRAYLIGNVPGLQDSTSWHVVQDVIGSLAAHGYCVVDYASLDAADYGVPQHRIRPFWFGHLDGPCLRWPARTHGAPSEQLAIGGAALKPWVTCRQALGHLPLEDLGRPVRIKLRPNINAKSNGGKKQGSDVTRCSTPNEPARPGSPSPTIRGGGEGHSAPQVVLLANEKHPVNTPDAPSMTITAKGDGRGAHGACVMQVPELSRKGKVDGRGHGTGFATGAAPAPTLTRNSYSEGATLEWPWDRPSTVVTCRATVPPPGHHPETGSILSMPNAVILSERAAAILQGFPETWVFSGETKKARWSQIGQAMPPGLAEPVFRAIVEQMRAARGERAA